MIHVDRCQAPKSLTDDDSPGVNETRRAIEFYRDPDNAEKPMPSGFKAYKGDDVRQTLNELFHYKCAYCESYYGATQPVAIEHFRPKGAVTIDGRLVKPGYYWLAANWDNLLPSCTDCNSERTQEVSGHKEVQGKANQFSLEDESRRAKAPLQESQERCLLLNPCLDEPEEHLVFVVAGDDDVVVRPVLSQDGRESRIGKESIRVYALLRSGLVAARRDRIKLIKAQVSRVDRYIRCMDRDPGDPEIQEWLKLELEELKRLLKDDQPYAAMARQYVKNIMGE